MTEIPAKTQVATLNSITVEPQGFKTFPYSSSTNPSTIAELERRATDLRTSYRTVSEALFEFGDKLLELKEKVKKAGLKWSKWAKFHFPDMNKQVSDALAIAHIWRELWEDDRPSIEKMKGWGTPVIAQICRGGLEIVKRFLSENDNPLAWTVKSAKALVKEWKNPSSKGSNPQVPQKAKATVPTARLAAIDKAIAELSHLRSMKQTLAEELEVAVTTEVRDRLKQELHQTELKIEKLLARLVAEPITPSSNPEVVVEADGGVNPTPTPFESEKLKYEQRIAALEKALAQSHQAQQPALTSDEDSELVRANRIQEQLRQKNLLLTERLEQLEAALQKQAQQPSPASAEVAELSERERRYQSQIEALQTRLEQQHQENAHLWHLFQTQEAENLQKTPEVWSVEKQALEHRISELEQALSQTQARAIEAPSHRTVSDLSPNCIVRILRSGNGDLVGTLGRYLGEGTATNGLGDPYPVAKVLIEEGSKYEQTVNVSNWTENLELTNLTLEEHRRVIAARYAVLERNRLVEEVKQLSQRVEELETVAQAYSTEAIAADLGKVLAPVIGSDKVQELVAVGKNGLHAIGRYLRGLLPEPAF